MVAYSEADLTTRQGNLSFALYRADTMIFQQIISPESGYLGLSELFAYAQSICCTGTI
jgi:hypothetical protein